MKSRQHFPPRALSQQALDDALQILHDLCQQLPMRSIQRDILVCAQLYLLGDLSEGNTVARWWNGQTAGWWKYPGELDSSENGGSHAHAGSPEAKL